jgi:hypothetical protein
MLCLRRQAPRPPPHPQSVTPPQRVTPPPLCQSRIGQHTATGGAAAAAAAVCGSGVCGTHGEGAEEHIYDAAVLALDELVAQAVNPRLCGVVYESAEKCGIGS